VTIFTIPSDICWVQFGGEKPADGELVIFCQSVWCVQEESLASVNTAGLNDRL